MLDIDGPPLTTLPMPPHLGGSRGADRPRPQYNATRSRLMPSFASSALVAASTREGSMVSL